MTTQPENTDKVERKIAKDELTDKEMDKVTGGDATGCPPKPISTIEFRKAGGGASTSGTGI